MSWKTGIFGCFARFDIFACSFVVPNIFTGYAYECLRRDIGINSLVHDDKCILSQSKRLQKLSKAPFADPGKGLDSLTN